MEKIKIAIVTGSLNMGGAELMTLNLASGLAHLNYDVSVVTVTEPGVWFHSLEEHGIGTIHIAGRQQVHPYRHAWRIGKRLRQEGFRVVVLTKYSGSERCTQAALNMLPDDVVVIPWIHSDTREGYKTALTNNSAWNVAIAVGAKITESASRICWNKNIIHIPNGLDFPPVKELNDKRTGDTDIFQLCYLGRLQQHPKNIFSLPVILEQCRNNTTDLVLHVIGDGSDRKELEDRFNNLGLSVNVVFHGAIPNRDVFKILCQSHVLLLPSFTEAMPCAPIEAQFCGCVPIVSRLSGVTDTIIDEGETGILVDVDDIRGFAHAVTMLGEDRGRWSRMSLAGMERAKQYSVEAMCRRFDELIQNSLQGEYALERSRRKWLSINPLAMTWREAIPRGIHKLGLGKRFREIVKGKMQ